MRCPDGPALLSRTVGVHVHNHLSHGATEPANQSCSASSLQASPVQAQIPGPMSPPPTQDGNFAGFASVDGVLDPDQQNFGLC